MNKLLYGLIVVYGIMGYVLVSNLEKKIDKQEKEIQRQQLVISEQQVEIDSYKINQKDLKMIKDLR